MTVQQLIDELKKLPRQKTIQIIMKTKTGDYDDIEYSITGSVDEVYEDSAAIEIFAYDREKFPDEDIRP